MAVTVDSATNYEIEVDSDNNGTGVFRLVWNESLNPASQDQFLVIDNSGSSPPGTIEQIEYRVDCNIRRSGSVEWISAPGAGDPYVDFMTTGQSVATIDSNGTVDLSEGSLSLPQVSTLPSPAAEGQAVIYDNSGAGWKRLAVYINGAWRMSSNL